MDDLLEIAIKMEENGEAVYNKAIKKSNPLELNSMLKWMANEEAAHGRWFADQKNTLYLEMAEAYLKKMVPQVLQDMMGENTLSLDEVNFNDISTVPDLIETFISFENDTILFYELLEMFVEQEKIKTGLKKIIAEEKNHIKTLRSMMASMA
ncbi:MAG: ferritin family protein [Proteobacteria bacterium]|nr:ferritin family protein [Pseudomonadota bacterium]MBU1583070.1 ferritin family protein [Pseudomonadota bacterium]MBU2455393.1 ferritin family protein [Pseudomonadota bacterium]